MDLRFVNQKGGSINLVDNDYFYLVDVDGQTNATADISSVVQSGTDGDNVVNIQVQPRTIVLDMRIKSGIDVEIAKRYILNVFKIKKTGSLIWTQKNKTVTISGIVESVDMPRWNDAVAMQISLYCEQPFWEDVEDVLQEISEAINLHYFTDIHNDMLIFPAPAGIAFGEYDLTRTREFTNKGDVAVGMDIEIIAYATVTNPIIRDDNGNFFGVGYGTGNKQVKMSIGDVIRISTHKGKKSIYLNDTSIISKIKPKSTWLQLEAGENTFTINSDDDSTNNMTFTLTFKQRYI